jgi:hypothetical protein
MKNKIDTVFVLSIFCVFAASVLLVVMLSGSTYANMTDIAQSGQNERVLLSYIRTKIRNFDNAGAVSVGDFYGHSALFIGQYLDGRDFVTAIYLYDGMARELFHERDSGLLPEDGIGLLATDYLRFENAENGLVRVVTSIGESLIFPRSSNAGVVQ